MTHSKTADLGALHGFRRGVHEALIVVCTIMMVVCAWQGKIEHATFFLLLAWYAEWKLERLKVGEISGRKPF